MSRFWNAAPALVLLVGGILLVLFGQPQAFFLLVDAKPGSWEGTCDGEPVAFVVEPCGGDSTGILFLPCVESVDVWQVGGEWVGELECRLERGGE